MVLRCINCTYTGTLEIRAANFSMVSDDNPYQDVKSVEDFFEYGYLELAVDGMHANMSFELSLKPGFTITGLSPRLPTIPVAAIDVSTQDLSRPTTSTDKSLTATDRRVADPRAHHPAYDSDKLDAQLRDRHAHGIHPRRQSSKMPSSACRDRKLTSSLPKVPDNSTVVLNVSDIASSYSTGL